MPVYDEKPKGKMSIPYRKYKTSNVKFSDPNFDASSPISTKSNRWSKTKLLNRNSDVYRESIDEEKNSVAMTGLPSLNNQRQDEKARF